jgi:hypothetical protein
MILTLAIAGPAVADKEGKGKGKKQESPPSASELAPGKNGEAGQPAFSSVERREIEAFFAAHPDARNELPPGLAKKNKIPPGWQKKLARGQPIPDDIWAFRVPLPHEILIKLPPPPPGVVIVRIHDRILRVREETHELLDELGLPHPP